MDACPVSVVIPSYNRADRIAGAIASAARQELRPLEIIVVDDGSTDRTDAARLEAIDERVRVIRHPVNRGSAAARNTGMDVAAGEWIAFLDADDRWLPGKLARQMSGLAEVGAPAFACSNVTFDGGPAAGKPYNHRPPRPGEDLSRYFLKDGCTFQTSTLVVPAELARRIRFDPRLSLHEDWDFMLRLVRSGARYLYCHEPLARYCDADDPTRLSKMSAVEPSLFWIREAAGLIAPDAAAAFYFRTTFRRHLALDRRAAILTGAKLTLRSARAIAWVAGKVVLNVRDKLAFPLHMRG